MYKGSDNTIGQKTYFKGSSTCNFYLKNYPFDIQNCHLTLTSMNLASHILVLTIRNLTFFGEKILSEYEVGEITYGNGSFFQRSSIEIEIKLKNMYVYFIISTYIPSLLLVIISYLPFWFDLDDFGNRVMVGITSLLVLAALFTQTSSVLPSTSYLKLIDIWFLCCILLDFFMIVLIVLVNSRNRNNFNILNSPGKKMTSKYVDMNFINKTSRLVVFILITSFVLSYLFYVIYIININ